MNLDAVTLQAGRDNSHTFRLCVTLDRDRLDTTSHRPRQLPVGRDEGVGLELCEGDVLGVYRDSLGLEQVVDWSSDSGRVVLLDAGRATPELFDEAQAANGDLIEVGRRVSGSVRFAFEVADSESTADRLVAAGSEQVAPVVTPPWGGWNVRLETPHRMQLTLFSSAE